MSGIPVIQAPIEPPPGLITMKPNETWGSDGTPETLIPLSLPS